MSEGELGVIRLLLGLRLSSCAICCLVTSLSFLSDDDDTDEAADEKALMKIMGAFTPGLFCFVPKRMICSKPICIFSPWVFLCSRRNIAKRARADASSLGFPYGPHSSASCVLVVLCTVGQCQDGDNNSEINNKMSGRLIWCSEEVKCLTDIWED